MSDQETIATAIKAAIAAAVPASVEVYDLDEIPSPAPVRHVQIELNRRFVDVRGFGGWVEVPGYDLTTRCHAETLTNVRTMRAQVTAALENQILPGDIGPCVFRIGEPEGDDDTGWVGSDFWTL